MKTFLAVFAAIVLFGCGDSGSGEATATETPNLLHGVAAFTSDSLVNVVIEIPAGTNQKWEVNKKTGRVEWQRISSDSLRIIDYLPYPANYGFVPQTLLSKESGGDGDPVDVFVLGASVARESVVKVRILGIIDMLDDDESDAKLLGVDAGSSVFDVNSYEMLVDDYPEAVNIMKLWLANYKGTDNVKIRGVEDEKAALHYLKAAHRDYTDRHTK